MKAISNGTKFTYTSYRDSNDNNENMWIAVIRTINGIKMDLSGKSGYINFSYCRKEDVTMYASTKKKLDTWILELAEKNELSIKFEK
tara:strand:- start:317 stop:577 length:261 start_codon:yes stop_codon:yes gene_type:complete